MRRRALKERLRRLWRALSYDPLVEYQRAKDLLERRLTLEADGPRRPRLKLVRRGGEGQR